MPSNQKWIMHRIIIRYKHFKVIAVISFFCFFFLIDFSSGFSLRDKSAKSGLSNSVYPRSYKLTNGKSDLEVYNRLDQSFNSFIKKWDLAGASVAIAKDGKLLYAKGFGYAVKEDSVKAEPYSMYRIASVSKLITAVGVMKLIEDKNLTLDTKVFGKDGLLNDTCYSHYVDKRVEDITVKNLLNHSAGWTSYWGDHMFINDMIAKSLKKPLPISLQDIVVFSLSKRLHFQPSTYSSYCNLGFSILQLVVEKASGQSYESYIKENVFYPLNIEDANLAFNSIASDTPMRQGTMRFPRLKKLLLLMGLMRQF